ncbi:TIGR03619 family F420-dependent LLM class oxidoreductase [Rhodococcus rhodochrous]|uniref:TIGR03619 family F420-dependent LLM class oxidoreductase n=1 Tax=Rhodococcus rhodochrous TaxID=1829 RepID=UPI001E4D3C95|nr:TIGR03619 family F420-dependent LLM class oxidoreductase [Rhodococcus rhodochrous]MCB8913981.1 TIGR03619 family F420-dependent LLM class oxidoreductase [Rhodococcus rhodochrous]
MRITISLPRPGGRPDGTIHDCVELARVIETCGAHSLSVTDHPFPLPPEGAPGHQAHDPFTLLSFLAAHTSKIRLQISLLVAGYRNPFLAARMVATLDQVSQGRAMVTLGAGYQAAEFAALGVPFEDRGRLLREAPAAMREAWLGKPVRSRGLRWTAAGNVMSPACVQRPHPPLWRGGNAPAALVHAATSFDGWAPLEVSDRFAAAVRTAGLQLHQVPSAIARLNDLWKAAGRVGTPDVALVRTRTDWLADAGRVRDEIAELADAGVTWVELTPAGATIDDQTKSVSATLGTLADAGLLESL